MKTYKLLKDLPIAKAGTIVKIEDAPVKSNVKLVLNVENTEHPLCAILDNQIFEWLKEIPEPKSIWNIKKQDEYYTIINGIIYQYDWSDSPNDKRILEDGNIFLTREEAEKELNKRQAIQRIKKYCWENGIKPLLMEDVFDKYIKNKNNGDFYRCYCVISFSDTFKSNCYHSYIMPSYFYFETESDIEKVIKNCEDDLKIIFNI